MIILLDRDLLEQKSPPEAGQTIWDPLLLDQKVSWIKRLVAFDFVAFLALLVTRPAVTFNIPIPEKACMLAVHTT